MNFQTINSTLLTLWEMLHVYLPLFILIGVFQTAVSMYGIKSLYFSRKDITDKEADFLRSLDDFNDRSSDIVLVLAFIGTVFGMILALLSLSESWGVSSSDSSEAGLRGAAVALTSTLGGLFFARLWGQHINDALLQKIFNKFHIQRDGDEQKYIKNKSEETSQQVEKLVELITIQNKMIDTLLHTRTGTNNEKSDNKSVQKNKRLTPQRLKTNKIKHNGNKYMLEAILNEKEK